MSKITLIFIIAVTATLGTAYFQKVGARDDADTAYWQQRFAQCRSIGYDLNSEGKCVAQ